MMLTVVKNGPVTDCPGLRFEDGRWVRRYKSRNGKMKQYTFAMHEDITQEQAIAYVESVRGQDDPMITTIGEPTIGTLVNLYLNEYVTAQRTTQSLWNARSALTRNLKPIHTRKLDDITAADLHEIILTVKARAPSMAQLLRSELRQAWSYGLAVGLTNTPCPITSMTGGKFKRQARDRILGDTELAMVLQQLAQFSETLADIIVVSLYTGLRSGEVAAIHGKEIERDQDDVLWITIPRERMKNNQAHRVPIFGRAIEVFIRRQMTQWESGMQTGYLFPMKRKQNKPIPQATLAREIYRVTNGAWRLHDLRRTTRTNLQRIGCPFEISETILAHKLPGVAGVYARFRYEDEKKQWLQALADYYDKLNISKY